LGAREAAPFETKHRRALQLVASFPSRRAREYTGPIEQPPAEPDGGVLRIASRYL